MVWGDEGVDVGLKRWMCVELDVCGGRWMWGGGEEVVVVVKRWRWW